MKHRVVFLHTEWAGYFGACTAALAAHPEVESVHVIHWESNPDAPFEWPAGGAVHRSLKSGLQQPLLQVLDQIAPTALFVSGWVDRDYLAAARRWRPHIPVVLCMDNRWTGSWRQRAAAATAPFTLHRHFDRIWVPGTPQMPFAARLGFPSNRRAIGLYCADNKPFDAAYQRRKSRLHSLRPTLVFAGRYVPVKGIDALQRAFAVLAPEFPEWELHCVGTGPLAAKQLYHPQITHHGFLQPSAFADLLRDAAVFVLPSREEPWGVVLHEMALAGLPLAATPVVGSASRYLTPGLNGTFLDPNNLSDSLRSLLQVPLEVRAQQSEASRAIGLTYTPAVWAETLLNFLQGETPESVNSQESKK